MGAHDPDHKAQAKESAFWSLIGRLSSSGLAILGALYLIGYIVVNGYQTKSMHYSSSALQLKHLTAGALYALLTAAEVVIVSWSVASGVTEFKIWKDRHGPLREGTKTAKLRFLATTGLAVVRISAVSLLVGFFAVGVVFSIIGLAGLPRSAGLQVGVNYAPLWTLINVAFALGVASGLIKVYGEQFDKILPPHETRTHTEPAPPSALSYEEAVSALRSRFISDGVQRFIGPVGLAFCFLYSMISFQNIYGRLKPGYGGGALYRVSVQAGSESKLPESIRSALLAPDAWLLLADRDDHNVFLLRVDKSGGRRLFQIDASEIAAVETLDDDPMHPDDAIYRLQHPSQP